ncbi:MAG TPA: hypothetical protein VGX26_01065 [Solirubrobacteraceae bacterium]|nr:hypothetical protein [Solirubrobacteraceae bacterium]
MTWPLPALGIAMFGVGLAALAHTIGWNATPSFNVGVVIASVVVVFATAVASDL